MDNNERHKWIFTVSIKKKCNHDILNFHGSNKFLLNGSLCILLYSLPGSTMRYLGKLNVFPLCWLNLDESQNSEMIASKLKWNAPFFKSQDKH